MNCHKCGHPADNHLYGQFCVGGTDCMCRRSQHDVNIDEQLDGFNIRIEILSQELAAWKDEALAAREYINKVDEFLSTLPIDIQYVLPDETNVYLAAKVKDAQP